MANELDAFIELVKNRLTPDGIQWRDREIKVWNSLVDSDGNSLAISDGNAIADGEGIAGP